MRWILGWCLMSCGGPEAAGPPVEVPGADPVTQTPAATPKEPDPRRYVMASRLNLRGAASADAKSLGKLEINSPVEVLETRDGMSRVRAGNGKEGWVSAEFLAERPLTAPQAVAKGTAAADPAERLAWAQRAAAIAANDDEVLGFLAEAYRAAGQESAAAQVERRREWPEDLKLAGAYQQDGVWLELLSSGDHVLDSFTPPTTSEAWQELPRPLTETELRRLGVELGQRWWVLPMRGAAVEATVTGGHYTVLNECGATMGVRLSFDAQLPEGETALAFSRSTPPESWRVPAPEVDSAEAERIGKLAAAKAVAEHGRKAPVHNAVRSGDGWFVRVAEQLPQTNDFQSWFVVDYRVDGAGNARQVEIWEEWNSFIGYERPTMARDLDGDGRLDVIWADSCSMRLEDADGAVRNATAGLCCGC